MSTRTPATRPPATRVVSRHRTADGILIWTRAAGGELEAVFEPYAAPGDRYVVAGGRHPAGE